MSAPLVSRPNWIDLAAATPSTAYSFYGELFGWEFPPQQPQAGGWRPAMLDGQYAAGVSPRPSELPASFWTVFFGTDDIEAAFARAVEFGATPMMTPMPIVIDGTLQSTIGVLADPAGALFGLAQQGANPGITATGPGTAVWFELASTDVPTARQFYSRLLVAELVADNQAPMDYQILRGAAGDIAGTMPASEGMPSAWNVYFQTDDVEASLAKVTASGGSVLMTESMHVGRIAVAADPEGATFCLITPIPPS